MSSGLTIDSARRELTARLTAASLDSPELDARLLIGAALGLDLTGLISQSKRVLTPLEQQRIAAMAERRLAGEPAARIVGTKEFWGLPLRLSVDTLVPRPDTETVVELALEAVSAITGSGRALRIADLGTGSGAILLALLSELPDACGVGTDISLDALRTARGNAIALGLSNRAAFFACSYASALSAPFDLIVSNPPYVSSRDISDLSVEVRAHDPHRALDGGPSGLDAYAVLIPESARLLRPDGAMVLEVGQGQSDDVASLMTRAGLIVDIPAKADLAGIPRAVWGRKKPP